MNTPASRLQINEPDVIAELVDGEVILVNFKTGAYFSARGTAADMVRLLLSGCTADEVASTLANHHRLTPTTVQPAVDQYVGELVSSGLFAPQTAAEQVSRLSREAAAPLAEAFATPKLEQFDDLADQLLLDPIHELEHSPWSAQKTA